MILVMLSSKWFRFSYDFQLTLVLSAVHRWGTNDNNFPSYSYTFRNRLTDFNNAIVWLLSILFMISNSHQYFIVAITVERVIISITNTTAHSSVLLLNSVMLSSAFLGFPIHMRDFRWPSLANEWQQMFSVVQHLPQYYMILVMLSSEWFQFFLGFQTDINAFWWSKLLNDWPYMSSSFIHQFN